MIFTNDFIKNSLTIEKQICNDKKIALLLHFNKLIFVASGNELKNNTDDALKEFKDTVDKLNYNLTSYDNLISSLNSTSEEEASNIIQDEFPKIQNTNKEIDLFINKVVANIKVSLFAETENNDEGKEQLQDIEIMTEPVVLSEINQEDSSENLEDVAQTLEETNVELEVADSIEPELKDNNTLLISEKEGKIFLPYRAVDLEDTLKCNSSYSNFEDIINDKYTLPMDTFKNPVLSRFKEAYYLMKNKENKNIVQSLELGLDLAFNYELNPAIIAACRNIDELDVYLDCLEENELDKFNLFEIKYEITPR